MKKTKKKATKKFLITEGIYLNWECEATSAEEAREMYEVYISDAVQRDELLQEALENKWDADINIEDVSDKTGF